VITHEETIVKNFPSKRQMVEFVHFLEADEILIQRQGETWNVLYNANKTTVTLSEDDFSEVDVMS
jgi:hypothetical protein